MYWIYLERNTSEIEVRANFRSLSQTYHSYKHRRERTGINSEIHKKTYWMFQKETSKCTTKFKASSKINTKCIWYGNTTSCDVINGNDDEFCCWWLLADVFCFHILFNLWLQCLYFIIWLLLIFMTLCHYTYLIVSSTYTLVSGYIAFIV